MTKLYEFTTAIMTILLLLATEIIVLTRKENGKLKRVIETVTGDRGKLKARIKELEDKLAVSEQSHKNAEGSFLMAVDFIKNSGIEPPVMVYGADGVGYPESIVIREEP